MDEAGRGPVLGPLVVACAITQDERGIQALGVRDSKRLSPAARLRIEPQLKRALRGYAVVALEASSIDARRARQTLNEVEVALFAEVVLDAARRVRLTSVDVLRLDAADTNAAAFGRAVGTALSSKGGSFRAVSIVAEHRADDRYPSVAAASILAKVERDRRVDALAREIGMDIGSGYPSDPTTIRFLREYISANGDVPPFCRRSWQTARDLLNEAGHINQKLEEFE